MTLPLEQQHTAPQLSYVLLLVFQFWTIIRLISVIAKEKINETDFMSRHALQRFIIFLQNVVADFHILKKFILLISEFQTYNYNLFKYNSYIEDPFEL